MSALIVVGAINGLILLPVTLSWFGPPSEVSLTNQNQELRNLLKISGIQISTSVFQVKNFQITPLHGKTTLVLPPPLETEEAEEC